MTRATVPAIIARVAGFFALLVAAVPLNIAYRMYDEAGRFASEGIAASATVAAIEQRRDYDGRHIPVAVLEFIDDQQQPRRVEVHQSDLDVGQTVDVVYLPGSADDARLRPTGSPYTGAILLAALSGIPLLFGLFLIWLAPGLIRNAIGDAPPEGPQAASDAT